MHACMHACRSAHVHPQVGGPPVGPAPAPAGRGALLLPPAPALLQQLYPSALQFSVLQPGTTPPGMRWWQAQWNALAQRMLAGTLGENAMLQQFLTLLRGAKPLYAVCRAAVSVCHDTDQRVGQPGVAAPDPQFAALSL